jgi:outer membrane murein-binding lipoprotein Lpp|tara:strand:- start:1044 stop:1259 length:216 start_codon:yes stop_codon:yes gene_type:complete
MKEFTLGIALITYIVLLVVGGIMDKRLDELESIARDLSVVVNEQTSEIEQLGHKFEGVGDSIDTIMRSVLK